MISALTIQGFKRFANETLELGQLTVLAGLNGAGKTSVIHCLLLAREASMTSSGRSVRLNGPFGLELGTAGDVRNRSADGDIVFTVTDEKDQRATWRLSAPSEDSLYVTIAELPAHPPHPFATGSRVFTYLCAERLGPRSVLGAFPLPEDDMEVGVRGEYSAQLIGVMGPRPLRDELRLHPTRRPDDVPLLKYEVEKWLGEIATPVEIDAEEFPIASVTALKFRSPGGDWVRAPNMGFGVSYALPVVLAGLVAAPGSLLIVENPEAHLHPAGQSRMGVFLAWLAGKGLQVIVETHSDHVLNGVRRSISEHSYLSNKDAVIEFFDSDGEGKARVRALRFTESGGISEWPLGFFDQYQLDVAALGRFRRRG